MVLNHAEESYNDRLSYIQESMYSTGYSWVDRAADNAYPRRIESLRRYSARKPFLLDRKIEQIGIEDIFIYFLLFHFLSFCCS